MLGMLGMLGMVRVLRAAFVAFVRHWTPFWQLAVLPCASLLLAPDALERLGAGLDVHELAGLGVPLHPVARRRLGLGPAPDGAGSVAVPDWLIRRHTRSLPGQNQAVRCSRSDRVRLIAADAPRIAGIGAGVKLTYHGPEQMIQGNADALPPPD
jgi:hypothetical protein